MTWPDTFRQLAERLPFALYSDYVPGKSVGVDNSATPREVSGNPVVVPGAPFEVRSAPAHGEHTDAVLAELGYGDEARAHLRADGVI